MKTVILVILLFLVTVTSAFAQQGVPGTLVQQSPTMLNACNKSATGQGTAQQTLTLTPGSGKYVYLCGFDMEACATTAPTATLINTTTTGFPAVFKWQAVVGAANTCAVTSIFFGFGPLKSSSPGAAVTLVTNAAIASVTYNINAYWYEDY